MLKSLIEISIHFFIDIMPSLCLSAPSFQLMYENTTIYL